MTPSRRTSGVGKPSSPADKPAWPERAIGSAPDRTETPPCREASGGATAAGARSTEGCRAAAARRQPVLASRQISRRYPWPSLPLPARLGIPPLDHRWPTSSAVPGISLLLFRLGGDRPASPTARVRLGAVWSRPAGGQPQHRSDRGRDIRRVLLALNIPAGEEHRRGCAPGAQDRRVTAVFAKICSAPLPAASFAWAAVQPVVVGPGPLKSPTRGAAAPLRSWRARARSAARRCRCRPPWLGHGWRTTPPPSAWPGCRRCCPTRVQGQSPGSSIGCRSRWPQPPAIDRPGSPGSRLFAAGRLICSQETPRAPL